MESAVDPPSDILQAGSELIFVESYQQKQSKGSEGTAKMPFRSKRVTDPLTHSDPWAKWEKGDWKGPRQESMGPSTSSSDSMVMTRLAQAEQAIQRVEARQERTEHELGSLNALVNKRFDEVVAGFIIIYIYI